jgi:hypothetical protein
MMQTMMFVTAKDGSAAKCVGDEGAMNAIQSAIEAAGFRFSDEGWTDYPVHKLHAARLQAAGDLLRIVFARLAP